MLIGVRPQLDLGVYRLSLMKQRGKLWNPIELLKNLSE